MSTISRAAEFETYDRIEFKKDVLPSCPNPDLNFAHRTVFMPRQQKPFEPFLQNKMSLATYLYSFFLVFALLFRAQAHRECTSCISLEDLLTEAYGIELAVDGL